MNRVKTRAAITRAAITRAAAAGLVFAWGYSATTLQAQLASQSQPVSVEKPSELQQAINEASARFNLPERWIVEVIRAESNGNARAVSHAGAQGLMQIMPGTWRYLRTRLSIGTNPFAVRDNVMAGSAYLRELYDRFGFPGCLAAYNAGPGRYQSYIDGRRGLPRETVNYVRIITSRLGRKSLPVTGGKQNPNKKAAVSPAASSLFVRKPGAAEKQAEGQSERSKPASSLQSDNLFVRSSKEGPNP